ncbi:MAG: alkaline phosphatase D family protein [Chitinophagales bacterium]
MDKAVNADQWDGYNSERNRFVNFIENNNVNNPVILTGDIHTSWVNNPDRECNKYRGGRIC